jgi:hypothetical protein
MGIKDFLSVLDDNQWWNRILQNVARDIEPELMLKDMEEENEDKFIKRCHELTFEEIYTLKTRFQVEKKLGKASYEDTEEFLVKNEIGKVFNQKAEVIAKNYHIFNDIGDKALAMSELSIDNLLASWNQKLRDYEKVLLKKYSLNVNLDSEIKNAFVKFPTYKIGPFFDSTTAKSDDDVFNGVLAKRVRELIGTV